MRKVACGAGYNFIKAGEKIRPKLAEGGSQTPGEAGEQGADLCGRNASSSSNRTQGERGDQHGSNNAVRRYRFPKITPKKRAWIVFGSVTNQEIHWGEIQAAYACHALVGRCGVGHACDAAALPLPPHCKSTDGYPTRGRMAPRKKDRHCVRR